MNGARALSAALGLGVAGVLWLLADSAVHALDFVQEAAYSQDLRRVQAVTAELHERVLESRSALLPHYDPLVESLRELARLQQRLSQVPAFLASGARAEVRAKVRACEQQLRRKDALVESFKTQNSVLQNSRHYFPVLASSLIDRARVEPSGDLVNRIETLVSALMVFDTAPGAESRLRVEQARAALSGSGAVAEALGLGREVELTLAHSKIIIERTPATDQLVRSVLSVPLSATVLELDRTYAHHLRLAIDHAHLRRQTLIGLALLIIVLAMTHVILRLRSSGRALEGVTMELRTANQELAREREKERQLHELKSRFVSTTSHEFRTPLSVIVSSSELLDRYGISWSEERRRDHLARIRAAAHSMWRMLDQLLLLGRAEAGVLQPSPTTLDLAAFCRHLLESAEYASARPGAIHYSFTGESSVWLDERLLSEVVGNLLDNALKYSDPESVVYFTVVVTHEQCRFTVRDRGIGIPEVDLPRLFQHFQRASNADQIKGTGLGLAVVKAALELQHGTVEVESQLGQGSQFVVCLPRARAHSDSNSISAA